MKLHYTKHVELDCCKSNVTKDTLDSINHKDKYWDKYTLFTYSFIGGAEREHQHVRAGIKKIKDVAPNIKFKEVSSNGLIRISFNPQWGSYSYVGTDLLLINEELETMNIGWFELTHRVVIHEMLHTLNFAHEHTNGINFNWEKLYKSFELQGWDKSRVDNNFKSDLEDFDHTKIDNESIMKYYIPCEWTTDGKNCGHNNVKLSVGDIKRLNELFPAPEKKEDELIPFLKTLFYSTRRLRDLRKDQLQILSIKLKLNSDQKKTILVKNIWENLNK